MTRFTGHRVFMAAVLLLALQSSCAADSPLPRLVRRLAAAEPTRIVCFGDSITGAYYHTGGQRAWCDLLGFALQQAIPRANLEMINAGVSGHTTVEALARIEPDVLDQQPDLVVVMFGMNDVTRVSLGDFRDHLATIARRCHQRGADVLLCTPNSVYPNSTRTNQQLAEYAEAIRMVARELQLPVVDIHQHWQRLRDQDLDAWMLLMSDTIHPNMNGHRVFAEQMAGVIVGAKVHLPETAAPLPALHHTFDQASEGQRITLVAMPPYDELMPALIRRHFPGAEFDVIRWPTDNPSLQQLAEWGKRIRSKQPDLVVPAVPLHATAGDDAAWVEHYEWVLNWSFPFAGRAWDVVPICQGSAVESELDQPTRARRGRTIIAGKDVRFLDRVPTDPRGRQERVADWMAIQKRHWRGARHRLPEQDDYVYVPTQSWPRQPGPRTVKVSIHYPGGRLSQVNEQTGIMLTLHNWGGVDCVGTADPRQLADRCNVVAVCVNYLQSGPAPSGDDPLPYDFGYLQAIDALRGLALVRRGLTEAGRVYADDRLFCTGGSGGGNVALMANKLAPHTFACVIDLCGMNKLSDDIAFDLPGGSRLNARWSRDPDSPNYLSPDQQQLRFVGHPEHLAAMQRLAAAGKIVVVHGVDDHTCPVGDAREMVANLRAAGLDVEPHFIDAARLDGEAFTSSGHALGDRTKIVWQVAGKYLDPDGPDSIRRIGATDFERRHDVVYQTSGGRYVISYRSGVPMGRFEPRQSSPR